MPLEHLTIEDYSDREFLLVLNDCADGDGYALAVDMAAQLDVAKPAIVSSRLSWLVRFGAVEREHKTDEHGNIRYHRNGKVMHTQRWRLTDAGRAIAFGAIKKQQQQTLDRLGDDQLLLVTRWLTSRTGDTGTMAKLAQREWRFGHARR